MSKTLTLAILLLCIIFPITTIVLVCFFLKGNILARVCLVCFSICYFAVGIFFLEEEYSSKLESTTHNRTP